MKTGKKKIPLPLVVEVGDWVVLKDGRVMRIDSDDDPRFKYEDIKRMAKRKEIPEKRRPYYDRNAWGVYNSAGNVVTISLNSAYDARMKFLSRFPGGISWARAKEMGFRPKPITISLRQSY